MKKELNELCKKYNAEVFINNDSILVTTPKPISEKDTYEFVSLNRNYKWQFIQAPKRTTPALVGITLKELHILSVDPIGKKLKIKVQNEADFDKEKIDEIFNDDGFFEVVEITCNDKLLYYYNQYVKKESKPQQDYISEDDILNLRIALEVGDLGL